MEQAVAFAWTVIEGSAQGIVAFVSGGGEVNRLADKARSMLPPFAVPSRNAEMPLNANGKVDRRSLRERMAVMAGWRQALERV